MSTLIQFKNDDQKTTFCSLWENEELLDVTLVCDDGQLQAHKVILSSASTFFNNLFKQNAHSHPLLYMMGSLKRHVWSLLEFINSGETTVQDRHLEKFMKLGFTLGVRGLVTNKNDEFEGIDQLSSVDVNKSFKSEKITSNLKFNSENKNVIQAPESPDEEDCQNDETTSLDDSLVQTEICKIDIEQSSEKAEEFEDSVSEQHPDELFQKPDITENLLFDSVSKIKRMYSKADEKGQILVSLMGSYRIYPSKMTLDFFIEVLEFYKIVTRITKRTVNHKFSPALQLASEPLESDVAKQLFEVMFGSQHDSVSSLSFDPLRMKKNTI